MYYVFQISTQMYIHNHWTSGKCKLKYMKVYYIFLKITKIKMTVQITVPKMEKLDDLYSTGDSVKWYSYCGKWCDDIFNN